jgi:putative oxidoreductase
MRKALLLGGRVLLGAVFVYAAYTKLRQSHFLFAMAIMSYKVLPESGALFLSRVLPWFELALGLALASGILLRYTAATASVLLAVFFGLMTRSYIAGQQISCGCFGIGEALTPRTLARDGLLLAVSLALTVGAFLAARRAKSPAAIGPPQETQAAAQQAPANFR